MEGSDWIEDRWSHIYLYWAIFYKLDNGDPFLTDYNKIDDNLLNVIYKTVYNVFFEEESVINKIIYYINNDFQLEKEYCEINNLFFYEKNNICQKLYLAIEGKYKNNTICPVVSRKWAENGVAVCVSSSEKYAPYLSVFLLSLIQHTQSKVDLIVFEQELSKFSKKKVQ